jgi:hypothetical protein
MWDTIGGYHDRKSPRGSRREPSPPLIQRGQFQGIHRCRTVDHLIVDREDARKIALSGRTHARHRYRALWVICYIVAYVHYNRSSPAEGRRDGLSLRFVSARVGGWDATHSADQYHRRPHHLRPHRRTAVPAVYWPRISGARIKIRTGPLKSLRAAIILQFVSRTNGHGFFCSCTLAFAAAVW